MRTVTGPPALLPPLSPHLGPIVWLGAPGGGGREGRGDGGDGERKERRNEEERGGGVGFVLAAEGEERKGRGALR